MLKKEWVYILVQIALMYVFLSVANALHSIFIAIVWMALALALGLLWGRIGSHRSGAQQRSEQSRTGSIVYFFAYFCGLIVAAIVAGTDLSLWHSRGVLMSLVGVPFNIPLGAFVLGVLVSTSYVAALTLAGGRLRKSDLYVMASLTVLSLAFSYLIFLHDEQPVLSASNLGPLQSLIRARLFEQHGKMSGLAPLPTLTPLLQFIGYVVGGGVVYWREMTRVKQPSM